MKYLITFILFLFLFTACDDNSQCLPNCVDKVCGDDGCGGACGTCTINEECSDAGTCEQVCNINRTKWYNKININLETVKVSGIVKINGKQMPDNTLETEDQTRGYVKFQAKNSENYFAVKIGAKGEATYSKEIYKGRYRVSFVGYDKKLQDAVPPYEVVLHKSIVIDKEMKFNFDLETVMLKGRLTLNGKSVPDNTRQVYDEKYMERGDIIITKDDTQTEVRYPIGNSGDVTYSAYLFKGNYTAAFMPRNYEDQNVFKQYRITLSDNLNINRDQVKDFDIKSVTLKGEITINGKTMPDNTFKDHENHSRGSIVFIAKGSDRYLTATLGSSGPAKYEITLYNNIYDVFLMSDYYQNAIIDSDAKLADDFEPGRDKTLNFNLDTVTLSGEVTLNGETMPDNRKNGCKDNGRGSLQLRNKALYHSVYSEIGTKGNAKYELTAYKGEYELFFLPQSSKCQDILPEYGTRLDSNINFINSHIRNFNLETATVKGEVTLDEKEFPEYYQKERGVIKITGKGLFNSYTIPLGTNGPVYYEFSLFKGNYEVLFDPNPILYRNMVFSTPGIIEKNFKLNSDTEHNFDVETSLIKGEVRLNGKMMPDNTIKEFSYMQRGNVIITSKEMSQININNSIGRAGPATYEILVPKGIYNIDFSANDKAQQNSVPDGGIMNYIGCKDETETLSGEETCGAVK